MVKRYKILMIAILSIAFLQCSDNKFNIAKGKVGNLTTKTTVQEIDEIFAND